MAGSSLSSSTLEELPPQHLVFINFRGKDVRNGFVSHLVTALKNHNINVFYDNDEDKGEPLKVLLTRIEESSIALAIFSRNYTESVWCLRELAKINDRLKEDKLVVIPIFYNVEVSTVKDLTGEFGDAFRKLAKGDETNDWEEALMEIPQFLGITVHEKSDESLIIKNIVEEVKKSLNKVPAEGSQNASVDPSEYSDTRTSFGGSKDKTFGIEQRLREMEEKLDIKDTRTRIIGVVGMPGIGKTTLLKELINMWKGKFSKHALIDQIREKSDKYRLECLPTLLFEKLLPELNNPQIDDIEEPYKTHKVLLHERKVLIALDDVSEKEQIFALLGKYDLDLKKHDWIKDGSRIIIATNDMSLLEGLVHDTYVVRQLNHKDGLQLFCYHAFDDDKAIPLKAEFTKLSDEFVHYARGHPLALKILGTELYEKSMKHWEGKLKILAQHPNTYIGEVLQVSYNELSLEQKDAFLDIACFRSQDMDYVESLLDSSDLRSVEAIKALKNKFLINTCDGRVDMHDLLYTFSRELDLKASIKGGSEQRRLWRHQDIIKEGTINVLQKRMRAAYVRGIFLDLSEVTGEMSCDCDHFKNMRNLRYLKFYNSHCPQECKTNNKINLPDGLNLPLKEVRCLHWLKFPEKELPNDFNPINLVDLKLPFSKIEQLWDGVKHTPVLKWVDLNHSSQLKNLSGLSKATKLQRLNLEECTSLESLGDVNWISLKTLTLSNCSNFKEFPCIPENLEALYLDGTAISQLPDNVENLERLVLLNMKDCKMLENIPASVGELIALQKLVLSGCQKLKDFPEINESSLKILLLDGTSIKTMPRLPSVQYLCLSRNDKIIYFPEDINQLSQLTWLDLKYCTSLTSFPELPPNLQYFDAHGCTSLKTVSKPLARILPTVQNHCTFCFTNCGSLEQDAKEEITSYAQRKFQLLSYARKHSNGGLSSEALFSICFPGCEVPQWFCHEAVGSLLQRKLPPHWHEKKLSGIALCAVVAFLDGQEQISCFSVTCTFKIKDEDKSWIPFTCPVGSWTRDGDEKDKLKSDHVFIAYITCPHTIRCLEDENSNKCSFTETSLEFTVTGGTSAIGKFKVLRCGLSLVYEKDKNKNSSHEVKFDSPVEASFQEPQHSMMDGEEKRRSGAHVTRRTLSKLKTL